MSSRPSAVAIFDLDRTITRAGTFTPFLLHCTPGALTKAFRVLQGVGAASAYLAGYGTRGVLKARMLKLSIAGAPRAKVRAWSEDFVMRWSKTHIRPGALAAIARHRAADDRLVLATASFDFYASVFAEQLGFDHVIATPSVWDGDERLCAALGGDNCYGAAKLAAVQSYLGALSAHAHIVAYSDHRTDLELLRWAHEGIVVNPNGPLRSLARAGNLSVVDWNKP